MEATDSFTINEVGQNTGLPFEGKFKVNLVLSRREAFIADERRRYILGANPLGAMPSLNGEALMLGDLFVRIIDGPKWWTDSDHGLNLKDENVVGLLWKNVSELVEKHRESVQGKAKESLEKLVKSSKKISQE